jgi:hypothetical protein
MFHVMGVEADDGCSKSNEEGKITDVVFVNEKSTSIKWSETYSYKESMQ